MMGSGILSASFLVCFALTGTMVAQSHDTYVCASLDADYVLNSNQSLQNGLFRMGSDGLWTHLGINDPYSTSLSFDPRDPDIIYTTTLTGALRTTDGGTTWKVLTDWQMTQPKDICVDPNEPGSDWFNGKSSAENLAEAREYLIHWMGVSMSMARGEYNSTTYIAAYAIPLIYLATWAEDPEMKLRGRMMLDWIYVDLAANTLNGMLRGPNSRSDDTAIVGRWNTANSSAFAWLNFKACPLRMGIEGFSGRFAQNHLPGIRKMAALLREV